MVEVGAKIAARTGGAPMVRFTSYSVLSHGWQENGG